VVDLEGGLTGCVEISSVSERVVCADQDLTNVRRLVSRTIAGEADGVTAPW
jgi:hypothetical protein